MLPDLDESSMRAATASVTAPYTWPKLPVETETAEPWLPGGWVADKEEAGHLHESLGWPRHSGLAACIYRP
ncbi:hypothetical protein [Streptomyces noursei]|uniref:hypothetical protein n=1 Tax=Streptomyces noursei TaxID=1971 RepID=UPI001F03E24F|nr:hypothetical protein [Streptomyces noursei]